MAFIAEVHYDLKPGARFLYPSKRQKIYKQKRLINLGKACSAFSDNSRNIVKTINSPKSGDESIHKLQTHLLTKDVKKIHVIFGSASMSRKEVIAAFFGELGISFEVCTPDINEKQIRSESPEKLVQLLGHAKADAVIEKLYHLDAFRNTKISSKEKKSRKTTAVNRFLISCDQVVVFNNKIREKPLNRKEAVEFLSSYSVENPPFTVGSVVLTNLDNGNRHHSIDKAVVHLSRKLSDEQIETLIKEGTIFNCAGALKVDHPIMVSITNHVKGGIDTVKGIRRETIASLLLQGLGIE